MFKKFVSIITLCAFVVFSMSCTLYKNQTKIIDDSDDWGEKDIQIIKLVKKSGEIIAFSEKQYGRIYWNGIIGTAIEDIEIENEYSSKQKGLEYQDQYQVVVSGDRKNRKVKDDEEYNVANGELLPVDLSGILVI